jgi:hypothetical protein
MSVARTAERAVLGRTASNDLEGMCDEAFVVFLEVLSKTTKIIRHYN